MCFLSLEENLNSPLPLYHSIAMYQLNALHVQYEEERVAKEAQLQENEYLKDELRY